MAHTFHPGSSSIDDARALQVLLEALIALNVVWLERHPEKPLYQAGVTYDRTVEWEPIPALYARGYGDCKSLTAARIAELRMQGIEARPVFRWMPRHDGQKDYHILVLTPRGFEDPSRRLGMGKDENKWFRKGA